MPYKIYPYKQGSGSAKKLSESLGGKVLKLVNSKYKPRLGDVVINWGSSNFPADAFEQQGATTFNADVRVAQNKLLAFQVFKQADVSIPEFWTNKEDIPDEAFPVVCRTVLNGHSGNGIVVASSSDTVRVAPLYVRYIKKKEEYRVHVFKGKAFLVQRKARKLDCVEPNWLVRNLAGGFSFLVVSEEELPSRSIIIEAEKAVEALGLDFGACDLLWNERRGTAYVLEVNTACGLEDRTAQAYAKVIKNDMVHPR